MSTQAIEVVNKNLAAVEEILASSEERFMATLPRNIPPTQFRILAMDMIRGTPALMEVMNSAEGQLSIIKGIFEASDMGLVLAKHLGQAYLVPFKNGELSEKYKRVIKEVQMIIGFRGFAHLIRAADPNVKGISSTIVWPQEPFLYNGPESLPGHDFSIEGGRVFLGNDGLDGFQGCYSTVSYRDGAHRVEWMPRHEIEAIRRRSKAKDNGPWVTDPAEMIKKTPLRRMAKWLPLTPAITAGIVRDEYRELGVENPPALPAKVSMPRRLSETHVAGSGLPQAGPVGGGAIQTPETDYSADIPPLCPKCGGSTRLMGPGISQNWKQEWGGAKWRCKDCPKNTKGCSVDAAEYHAKEQERLAKLAPVAEAQQREPGDDSENMPFPQ